MTLSSAQSKRVPIHYASKVVNYIYSSRLLALFGERVTMQLLSQAMGWSDCILLATALLGIITIIAAAIRVGGPAQSY